LLTNYARSVKLYNNANAYSLKIGTEFKCKCGKQTKTMVITNVYDLT